MPRCKHKMYCVCFFFSFVFFLKVAGWSWLLIRQEMVRRVFICLFCPMSCCLFSARRNLREKNERNWSRLDGKKAKKKTLLRKRRHKLTAASLSSVAAEGSAHCCLTKWLDDVIISLFCFFMKQFKMQYLIFLSLMQASFLFFGPEKPEVIMYSECLAGDLARSLAVAGLWVRSAAVIVCKMLFTRSRWFGREWNKKYKTAGRMWSLVS